MYWNLFKVYIFIVRRINFSVEFVPEDKFNFEHKQRLARLKRESEEAEHEEEEDFQPQNSKYDFLANFIGHGHPVYSKRKTLLSVYRRAGQTARGLENTSKLSAKFDGYRKICEHLSEKKRKDEESMRLAAIVNRSEVGSCIHPFNEVDSPLAEGVGKLDNFHHSCTHLGLFVANLLLWALITTKLILNSTIWSCDLDDNLNLRQSFFTMSSFYGINDTTIGCQKRQSNLLSGIDSNQDIYGSIQKFLNELIHGDCFGSFTNGPTLNMIGALFLFPATSRKLVQLFKLSFKRICFRANLSASSSAEPVSVVQLNLSYMNSLYASTSDWIRLTRESWYHKHLIHDFRKETSIVDRISTIEGSTPSRIDFKTRMYFYNLIQFNDCYEKYFPSFNDASDNNFDRVEGSIQKDYTSRLAGRSSLHGLKNLSITKSNTETKNTTKLLLHKSDQELFADANRKLHDIIIDPNSVGTKNVFIARPIHRLDLNEMSWLISMVLFAYIACLISIMVPTFCALMVEMDIRTSSQLMDLGLLGSSFIQLISSQAIFRFVFIFIWQVVAILSLVDLLSFYTSCLICFSRARHLRVRLDRLNELCTSIRNLRHNADENNLFNVVIRSMKETSKLAKAPLELPESEPQIIECQDKSTKSSVELASFNQPPDSTLRSRKSFNGEFTKQMQEETSKVSCNYVGCASKIYDINSTGGQFEEINNQMELLIDLCIIIQRELMDVKRFFTGYLNSEIIFKVLSLTLLVTTLLEYKSIFELIFLIFQSTSAGGPVVIVLVMATFIEGEFRAICKTMASILVNGSGVITLKNIKRIIKQADYLAVKSNRSFVVIGNFCLTLGCLVSVVGWIATGVVLLRR